MKFLLLLIAFLFIIASSNAQFERSNRIKHVWQQGQYVTFNPLALAEPQIAVGGGFGNRFSERSEYFAELSYVGKAPFYESSYNKFHGVRFIAQYRYHFLQQWKPLINLGRITTKNREKNKRLSPFVAAEFRLKPFRFSDNHTFINTNTNDTLVDFLYVANAVSIGGAILFGSTYSIGKNNNWKIEITCGIGGKQKLIYYKNLPPNYEPIFNKGGFGLAPPTNEQDVGMPYIPFALRLKYIIN